MTESCDSARRLSGLPRRRAVALLAGAAGLAAAGRAGATEPPWPSQPVRYINLFPPGGATDILSRLFCAKMSEITGQQFVVENRAGAGGTVGADAISKSRPDGTTIGLGGIATHAIAPSLYRALPYDAARDFTMISGLWQVPNLLFVNRDLPVRSVAELVDLARAQPGRLHYASSGIGTTPHLTMEIMKQRGGGLDIVHVPYRGGAPALLDLIGGRVQAMFDNIPTAIAAVREGRVRPLAVTSAERSPILPEVPTLAETFPGFTIISWSCLTGPAGLPPAMVARASALSRRALESPDLIRSFADNGATAWWTTPEDLSSFRAQQEALFAGVVRSLDIRVE